MRATHYSSTGGLFGKLWPRLVALATALLLAPAAWAQIEVPAGNPNGGSSRRPMGTWFGYERSAMIYTAAEIGTSGNLTRVGFYVSSVATPGDAPTKIYLKTVANATFAAATTVAAEETGATLVYDATIPAASFVPNTWVSVPLTAAFAYNGTSNLQVIVETNATGGGNEASTGKAFRYSSTGTGNNRTQLWATDTNPPTTAGVLSLVRPNIQLTGLTPLACPPVTGLTVSNITPTSAQIAFTPAASSSSYTVTYTAAGGTATTVTPAPTASPINLTGLTAGTAYTVTITGNCTGSTTSPVVTTTFSTPRVAPANDECTAAVTLTPGAPGACTNINGTVSGATQSNAPIPCGGFTATTAQDVWYSFTATATAHTINIAGNFDGVLEVLSGACGSLTNVGCSDSDSNNETLTLTALTVGTVYKVRFYPFGANPANPAFTICITSLPANDAAVQAIYALGKAPINNSQVVQAVVRNTGASALTNVPVTLNVSGATTFADAKIIPSLAVGASAVVSFTAYTPAVVGTNTLTVTLQPDGLNTNNTQTYAQLVGTGTISYANNTTLDPNLSVGFGATTTGAFIVKYNAPAARTLTGITAALADVNTVGRTLYGIVVSSTGTIVARTPDYVVTAADIDQRKTFPLATPLAVAAGDFYVGMVQTAAPTGGARYFPLGTLPQTPTRTGTFFTIAPFSPTAGGALVDAAASGLGIFVIEAQINTILSTNSPALARAISLFPNPSQGQVTLDIRDAKAKGAMQVQITNTLGQVVHLVTVQDNAANKLDLSGLATGMYVLRVQSGSEYSIRQLVLTK